MKQVSKYIRKDLRGLRHDSLEVQESAGSVDVRVGEDLFETRRQWKCVCKNCGQIWLFTTEELVIQDNVMAAECTSNASCSCHTVTGFQWLLMLVFRYHRFDYDTNIVFSVPRENGERKLKFDFAVYEGNMLKALIDCHTRGYYLNISRASEFEREKQDWVLKCKWCEDRKIQFIRLCSQRDVTYAMLEKRLENYKLIAPKKT